MAGLKNCYWNGNGRHQAFVEALEERLPGYGYTSNVYVNLFIAMSHLYYDAYNNGGGNIEDCYMRDFQQHIKPYLGDKVDPQAFIYGNDVRMEQMMDIAIAYIQEKNLDFPVYACWVNHMEEKLSMVEPGKDVDTKGKWHKVTFGDMDEMKEYARTYRDVSEEVVEIDGEIDLPETLTISASELALDADDIINDEEALADVVSDYLSDVYGFCHKGFDVKVVFNEFSEPSEFVVSNIEWGIDDHDSLNDVIHSCEKLNNVSSGRNTGIEPQREER